MKFLIFYSIFPWKADFQNFRKYTLIPHLQYTLAECINSRSLPVWKHKRHTNQMLAWFIWSITFLPTRHVLKSRDMGSSRAEITGCLDTSVSKTEYLVPKESKILFIIPLPSNHNKGCMSFPEAKRIKKKKSKEWKVGTPYSGNP